MRMVAILMLLGCRTPPLADGDAGFVACGSARCSLAAGELCCDDYQSPPTCTTSCPATFDGLACDGPEDCPGQKCCGSVDSDGATRSACATTCAQGPASALCHADSDCGMGLRCCPVNPDLYPGVNDCGSPCP